jgi:hypothetical protein
MTPTTARNGRDGQLIKRSGLRPTSTLIRKGPLVTGLLLVATMMSQLRAAEPEPPSGTINFSVRVQDKEVVLFPFDNYAIPFRNGLQMNLVAGQRYSGGSIRGNESPVLALGKPGEADAAAAAYYGTVIPIGNELRMWYLCAGDVDSGDDFSMTWLPGANLRVGYAVSADGIKWSKPALGLTEYKGNTHNNLVAFAPDGKGLEAAVVMLDASEPSAARRYKMIYETRTVGISVAYSPDGLSWTNSTENPVIPRGRDGFEPSGLIRYNGCYYAAGHGGNFGKRALVVYASSDFEHWQSAVDLGFRRDNIGPLHSLMLGAVDEQIHLGAGLSDRGNIILALYGQWHGNSPVNDDRRNVTMDIGFLISHDALHYSEPVPDFKMIPGADIKFASAGFRARLVQGQGMVNVGNETLTWFSLWGPEGGDGVRLATWTRDRFGYYTVPAVRGDGGQMPQQGVAPHFISCPIWVNKANAKVYVNAAGLGENSFVKVEILDEKFREIGDYSGSNCIPLTGNGLRLPVNWRSKAGLDASNQPIRIRVSFGGLQVEHARVYAVYLE